MFLCELQLFVEYYIRFCNYYMFGVSSAMTCTFTLLTVKHCEQIKRVVVGYSLMVMLT